MGAEYERKFRATPAALQQLLADYPGCWQTIAMETTYFDTPSASLSARRFMLRIRKENGIPVCTLKTPGEGNLRGEWETECGQLSGAVSELCKLGAPTELAVLCQEGLVPVCGAAFTRKALLLTPAGCTAELALDEGYLFGSRQLPLCEVELELKAGNRDALDAFADALAGKYGLCPEDRSKFARALALRKEN